MEWWWLGGLMLSLTFPSAQVMSVFDPPHVILAFVSHEADSPQGSVSVDLQ